MESVAEEDETDPSPKPVQATDEGGGVYPSQTCPHVFTAVDASPLFRAESFAEVQHLLQEPFLACCSACPCADENWICLTCRSIGCSRYRNSHAEEHFFGTAFSEDGSPPHCLALSRSDLSIWCYQCGVYIKHDRLQPILKAVERIKFPTLPTVSDCDPQQHREYLVGFSSQPEPIHSKHLCGPDGSLCYERPKRVIASLQHLENKAILQNLQCIEPDRVRIGDTTSLLKLVNTQEYIDSVRSGAIPSQPDVYVTAGTPAAAESAVERVVALVDACCDGRLRSGFALVRPPGHHAESDCSAGFCLFSNLAIAARFAQSKYGFKVAIVDWDIHHGNGAQRTFYNSSDVLTISIHKQVLGEGEEQVKYDDVGLDDRMGEGAGTGFNINIPLGANKQVGDLEYLLAFDQVVLPALAAFKPDLVLVAAGFDAGIGDRDLPVGGYSVSPQGYAQMTQLLLSACPRVVASLEGGYELGGLSKSIEAVVNAMLADSGAGAGQGKGGGGVRPPPPPVPVSRSNFLLDPETVSIVARVEERFKPFWEPSPSTAKADQSEKSSEI